MKTRLLLLLLITFLFANKPDGGYATWEDFEKGTPTYSADKFEIRHSGGGTFKYNSDIVRIKTLQDDGKTRNWRENKHGKLTIIKLSDAYYLNNPSVHLHYYENYSWFTIVTTTMSAPTMGANGQMTGGSVPQTKVAHYVLDMKTKKVLKLKKKLLRKMLKETPELAQEFEDAHFKRTKLLKFLKQFLVKTNS